jgi:hypothetical protein
MSVAQLGFKPVNATGAAKLYDQAQFPAMCEALIEGLRDAAPRQRRASTWASWLRWFGRRGSISKTG